RSPHGAGIRRGDPRVHGARADHRRRTRGCAGRHLLAVDAGLRDAHRTPAVRRLPRGAPDGGALHGDRAAGARGAPRGPAGHLAGAGEGDGQGTGGPLSRRRGVPRRPGITLVTDAPFVGRRAELAELAVALMASQEVGAALGISDRTVSTHLSNIFLKLAVDSRGALSDVVRERGLL